YPIQAVFWLEWDTTALDRAPVILSATNQFLLKAPPSPFVIPSVPGFPTSRLCRRQRMRLSVKRAARNPPKLRLLTGNLGQPRDLQCSPAPAQRSPFRQLSHRIVILKG